MARYVSTRLVFKSTSGAQGAFREAVRLIEPHYLRTAPDVSVIMFDGQEADTAKSASAFKEQRKDFLRRILSVDLEQRTRYHEVMGKILPEGANTFGDGIITFSADGIAGISDDKLTELAEKYLKRLCAEKHLKPIYLALHRDETVRHFHFMTTAVTDTPQPFSKWTKQTDSNGQTIRKQVLTMSAKKLNDPEACRRQQDMVAEVFAQIGLVQGISKEITDADYHTVKEGHENVLKGQQEEIEIQTSTKEACQTELNGIIADIKAKRATRNELAQMNADERKKHSEEMRKLRQEKKELKDAIESMKIEKANIDGALQQVRDEADELEKQTQEKISTLDRFMKLLQTAGAKVINVIRNTRAGHQKTEPQAIDLTAGSNLRGICADMIAKGGECHIKIADIAAPAIFCVNGVNEDALSKIRQEVGLLAAVQSSQGNYQAWVAVQDAEPISQEEWQVINEYLISTYSADRIASTDARYYNLPCFTLADGSGWTTEMADGPAQYMSVETARKILAEHKTEYISAKVECKKIRQAIFEEGIITDIPVWFIAKYQKARYGRNWKTNDLDRIDFGTCCSLLATARTPNAQLKYADWMTCLLSVEALKRNKGNSYTSRTVSAAYDATQQAQGCEMSR